LTKTVGTQPLVRRAGIGAGWKAVELHALESSTFPRGAISSVGATDPVQSCSLTARGTQFIQNTAQFSDGTLVNRVGTVYERVEIVASPPVRFDGWLTLAALHKVVPLLWVCGAVLQKSLNQVSNIRSCTVAGHVTYPNTHGQPSRTPHFSVLPAAEVQRPSLRTRYGDFTN
jgi:hypothetical protein